MTQHGFFSLTRNDGRRELLVEFDKNNRYVEPHDLTLMKEAFGDLSGFSVRLAGRSSTEAYFAAGYYCTLAGAAEIFCENIQPAPQCSCLKSSVGKEPETKPWLRIKAQNEIELAACDSEDGKWPEEALRLDVPSVLPSPRGDADLKIGGRAAVRTYAHLGVSAALAHHCRVLLDKPIYQTRVTPEGCTKHLPRGEKNGIVVGILGDPNSGKSVFSRLFYGALRQIFPSWYKTWIYDCDLASPTPEWYIENFTSADVKASRERLKQKWTPELEKRVVQDLGAMKTTLNLCIADMPGGDHKSDPSHPRRIGDESRAEMMRACDAFIILSRADGVFEAWREALARYGLEDRILANFRTHKAEDFSATAPTRGADGIFKASISGLNRNGDSNFMKSELASRFENIFRYLSYIEVARKAQTATVKVVPSS